MVFPAMMGLDRDVTLFMLEQKSAIRLIHFGSFATIDTMAANFPVPPAIRSVTIESCLNRTTNLFRNRRSLSG